RVEIVQELLRGKESAYFAVADKLNALLFHYFYPAQHDLFLVELHVRDAVHEQAARTILALENGHPVSGPVQLRGGAKAGRTGADDGDLLAGSRLRRPGREPAFLPAFVDAGALTVLDRYGPSADAAHAGAFPRDRTAATGETG